MNDFEDIEQLLKPQCEFKASDTLKQEVMEKARQEASPRRIVGMLPWLAAACVIGFALMILIPPRYSTEEQPVVAQNTETREKTEPAVEEIPIVNAEPVVAQAKPQEKPKARVVRTAVPTATVKQEEKPEVTEENLLAEAQNTPLDTREEVGVSPTELPVLPPERQALVDIFLAEEVLQVAYMQQELTKELRAFTAGLEGKEPETSHLIIAF